MFMKKIIQDLTCIHISSEENNEGLDIETVCRFVPGDIMIFDSCQIHASCLSKNLEHYKFLKNGLNIQFYREV